MIQFRRALRLLIFVVGVIAGILLAIVAYFTRFLVKPPRQKLWENPHHYGMVYEDVDFPALDGVRISGWLMPAGSDSARAPGTLATIIMAHGWPWCRMGVNSQSKLDNLPGASAINLLPLAKNLHDAGYNLLMIDLRNHGESASSSPVSMGWHEANDILGAINYLEGRKEVEQEKIGVIGFSMGANATLFALPRTEAIKAAVAVQPTTPVEFNKGFANYLVGPLSRILAWMMQMGYPLLSGGLSMQAIDPTFAAAGAGDTPVLYVQSSGDRWGNAADVARMAAATPFAVEPIWVDGERFAGYQYLVDHPEELIGFLNGAFWMG